MKTQAMRLAPGLALAVLVVLAPLAAAQAPLPDLVLAEHPGLHPEGIEWNPLEEHFLVGSITEGTIFAVADDGVVTPFVEDEALMSTIGLHIDPLSNRLLAANSDFGIFGDPPTSGSAQLAAYDLETQERLFLADLGALLPESAHFANDVATDAEGNAYVTDSMAATIYRVDAEGNAAIFLQSDAFASAGFGLNGIEYHPDGYLLVALAGEGAFFKVPVDDPEAFSPVALEEPVSGDGIILDAEGRLIVVGNTFNADGSVNSEVLALHSEDDWASATVAARAPTDPALSATTATLREGSVYVVHAHFGALMGGGDPVEAFEIMRVDLEMMAPSLDISY